MYSAFFKLERKPFGMTPDPAFLFLTDQHREALAGLTYAIVERKGFAALSGTAGAGKTTLLSWVLEKLPPEQVQSSVIINPTLTRDEFLEAAMLDFGIQDIPASKANRLWVLQKFLTEGKRNDKISVLVIDEAHKLSSDLLEEIRLLGNFEASDQKLLQVILIGQPELDDVLNRPDLWQFKQRISVRMALKPLSFDEVQRYVQHRWKVAGGSVPTPFTADALASLARWSSGIPRLINSICDNALILAFADTAQHVTSSHIDEAAKVLRLSGPALSPQRLTTAQKLRRPPAPALASMTVPQGPVQASVAAEAPIQSASPAATSIPRPMFDWYGERRAAQQSLFLKWASRLGLA
jgi:general secretion pathway protein A